MSETTPAIEIVGLTKTFGRVTAVNALDLKIPRGTTLGLLGPNGAGKSTTLKMTMGVQRPSAGAVRVFGLDVFQHGPTVKQRTGYVPEAHHIYRWMTVERTIRFTRALFPSWNDRLCEELLDLFRLEGRKRVRELSKGMLAKLSLSLALSHEPELLILDEPLSGLDPIAREDFLEGVLAGICHDDRTVVFSSHHIDEVNRLADSVAIVNEGRLLVHRPTEELVRSTRRIHATLQDGKLPVAAPPGTICQRVNRREWTVTVFPYNDEACERLRADNPVDHVDVKSLSLDDIFKDFIRGQSRE